MLDQTHEAGLTSWVESANQSDSDFPIQNLPFGVFRTTPDAEARCGIAIGDYVFSPSVHADLFEGPGREAADACASSDLGPLIRLGRSRWSALRQQTSAILSAGSKHRERVEPSLLPRHSAELQMPVGISNYTDFFSSIYHATNAGRIFRPERPLLPNYKHVPVAYHGRASSIVVSGTAVRRPRGQIRRKDDPTKVSFEPTAELDLEAEIGVLIGVPSELGEPIPISVARSHIFGLCLVNDWSARDIQAWEAQPLGPFLGKSFATTISPWIITLEALEPFRAPGYMRADGDPEPLPYLADREDQKFGSFDIAVTTSIRSEAMARMAQTPLQLSLGTLAGSYWTPAQMVAHHTSNGCNLKAGDLIATGTISGEEPNSWGSLLEKTYGGKEPILLPNGERRMYLQDFDEVTLTARCQKFGFRSIGFGECRGVINPAA